MQICGQVSTGGFSNSIDDILGPYTSLLGGTSVSSSLLAAASYTDISQQQTLATSTASTFATSSSSQVGFQASNPTSSTNSGGSTANPSSPGSSKSTLSTGAAVGVGVGVTLAGLAMLATIIFFCLRYRKRGKELRELERSNVQAGAGTEEKGPEVNVQVMQPEIDGRETTAAPKYEANPHMRNQGYGGGMPSELANQEWRVDGAVELAGVHAGRNGL